LTWDAAVKTTQYFQAMRSRSDRAMIRDEWIQRVIDHPVKETRQQDGRIRRGRQSPKWAADTYE
jgi:hypothetical protein